MSLPRARLKIHPAIPIAVLVFCFVLIFRLLWPIHLIVGEVTALIAMGLAFRYWPPMLAWFKRMPAPHRVLFALIFGAMLLGHFQFDNRKYFPFISWEIFSNAREVDPVTCREFVGLTGVEPGDGHRLLVEQLFPSIIQFDPPGDYRSSTMTALVHSLAREYNRQHPIEPVLHVDLVQFSVKLHPAARDHSLPPCQLLKQYDVSSASSN